MRKLLLFLSMIVLPLSAQTADTLVHCRSCVKVDSVGTPDSVPVAWRYFTNWSYTYRDSLIITSRPQIPSGDLPAGFVLQTHNSFDQSVLVSGWTGQSGYNNQYKIKNDPTISRDGSPYLELNIPAGHRGGTGFQDLKFDFGAGGCREVAYSFWFRSTPTPQYNSNVQKLIHWWGPSGYRGGQIGNVGLTNLYITPTGYTVYAAFQSVEPANLGVGSTNKQAKGISNQGAGGGFPFNTWVKFEGQLKMNDVDSPTAANGYHRIIRTSPTNVARVSAENVLWVTDVPVSSRTWRWVTIDPTIPGAIDVNAGNPVAYTLYFDDLKIGCK
jgi:hypothetical protein